MYGLLTGDTVIASAPGLDVLAISRRIGHSSPMIAIGVCGHLFENVETQAALVIDAALGQTLTD